MGAEQWGLKTTLIPRLQIQGNTASSQSLCRKFLECGAGAHPRCTSKMGFCLAQYLRRQIRFSFSCRGPPQGWDVHWSLAGPVCSELCGLLFLRQLIDTEHSATQDTCPEDCSSVACVLTELCTPHSINCITFS